MRAIVLFLVCFSSWECMSNLNFESWGSEGPYGGYFEYDGRSNFSFSSNRCSGQTISNIREYYFYKGATIGIHEIEHKTHYFIIRIEDCVYETFDKEKEWKNKIDELGFKPLIWTRWNQRHWSFRFNPELATSLMFFPLLALFLIGVIIIFVSVLFAKTIKHFATRQFRQTSKKSILLLVINVLVFWIIGLSIFPASI